MSEPTKDADEQAAEAFIRREHPGLLNENGTLDSYIRRKLAAFRAQAREAAEKERDETLACHDCREYRELMAAKHRKIMQERDTERADAHRLRSALDVAEKERDELRDKGEK